MTAHLSESEWKALAGRIDMSGVTVSKSAAEILAEPKPAPLPAKATHTHQLITGTIPGTPIGKPRQTRRDKWDTRPCVLRYRAWADQAREIMSPLPPAEAVEEIRFTAYFDPPTSWIKKKRVASIGRKHRVKPDADNVLKCMDALFAQDSAIADAVVRKRWDWHPRLEIEILLTPSMN